MCCPMDGGNHPGFPGPWKRAKEEGGSLAAQEKVIPVARAEWSPAWRSQWVLHMVVADLVRKVSLIQCLSCKH